MSICLVFVCGPSQAEAKSPFNSGSPTEQAESTPAVHKTLLTKIALYQQQLKVRMTNLIREVKAEKSLQPLLAVLVIAFGYGLIHAAGPGHGKAVAMSYILSRSPSIPAGLLFGFLVAMVHGLSGAVCVLALHFILQASVSGTVTSVSQVTQAVSFGLLALLGFGLLLKNGWSLLRRFWSKPAQRSETTRAKKGLVPWAIAVGLVPCPGVVMIMLFCLSMGVLALGLMLAASVSLGMAATLSCVVIAVVTGKAGLFSLVPEGKVEVIESSLGLISGAAIASLASLFLLTSLHQGSL
jgi:ABC-type nickel/cobalt efflux system permease component RcnA